MKTVLLCLWVFALSLSTIAQQADSASVEKVHSVAKQLQSATENRDVEQYVSVMASDATWDGPMGENAIGPDNIVRAASLTFKNWGRLRTAELQIRFLTPDLVLAEMFQRIGTTPRRRDEVAVAPGSVGPVSGSNLRTTLLMRHQEGRWLVIAVRIADLRTHEARSALSAMSSPLLAPRY